MRRLRLGEWLAALGGVALAASLLLDWYAPRARAEAVTGFAAFDVIDILLLLVAALAVALAVLQATADRPAAPVAAGVLTVTFGLVAVLLVLYRIANEPGPDEFLDVQAGAYLGLAAAALLTAGAWLSIGTERVPGLPPGPEPELRPPPRIASDAQP